MKLGKTILVLCAISLIAESVSCDTKVVKRIHQDGFSAMGQDQPPQDHEQTIWMGEGRLRMDQKTHSSIVRVDLSKLFMLNHDDKTYYEIDLPIDLDKLLPPGAGSHVMDMMKMKVSITPSDETRKVGPWQARRYDLEMSSAMMNMRTVIWASQDVEVDSETYRGLSAEMMKMQPGMHELIEKMSLVEGFIVAQEGRMTMPMLGDTEVGSSETLLSVEEARAPSGTYETPADYRREEFDYSKMMQAR